MRLPEAGGSVGHFEILERLGGGGMGVVYKARDLRLGRLVALKFMAPTRQDNQEARVRFLREAQAVAALDHPNVRTLYEIGEEEDGRIFLAMALCPGETLKERLRRGPLLLREAVHIALQVADGLAAAHALGIIHRDIKPGNLLICDGLVKIIDFGVAHLMDQTTITREGVAIGTLNYTAPEHLFGGEPGPESDLWSLGVVLYESLAGRPPFQAKTVPEMVGAILNKTPPRLEGVSPELCRIVERAIARSQHQRYQKAEEMQADLLACIAGITANDWDLRASTLTAEPVKGKGPPLLHNLPFPPLNDFLKGRNEDLLALEQEQGERSHVLYGLGGIGKTRLAVEHAWRCGSRYCAVLFVLADSPNGLYSGLARLARADILNLPERDDPAESELIAAVLRWLRDNSGWLLILDNVDTKEALLEVTRLLPALIQGRVLITSRRRDWPPGVYTQPIDVISLPAATDFLLKRTIKDQQRESNARPQAVRLAKLLDGLPLALEQAAAYITHTQISIIDYLEIWEKERDSALGWYDEAVMQYPVPLAVTWHKSFHQLAPTAQTLLRLLSHMAPDPIPVAMLEVGETIIRGTSESSRPIREDLGQLTALSLLSRQGSSIRMHRLVQEVVRQGMPNAEQEASFYRLVEILVQYAPTQSDDSNTWGIWDLLRPHAMEVLTRARERGWLERISVVTLMSGLGLLLFAKGLYSDAEPLMREVLKLDFKLFGTDHFELATGYSNLAGLLQATGRLEEAEPLIHETLRINRALFGDSDPRVARNLNQLGLLLGETGRWAEGEDMIRRALAIDQVAYQEDHSDVCRDLHNLAYLLKAMGRDTEAEPLIRRSLEMSRVVHGEMHSKTARKMQILASVLWNRGHRLEAEPLFRRSLEIFEQVLGPHHPRTEAARRDLDNLEATESTLAG